MNLCNSALNYRNLLSYSVIPVGHDKKPLVKWEQFQKRIATEEEIKVWWTKFPEANIGIVTGLVSGIAVIDIDEPDTAKPILAELIPDSLVFPICKTPSGGEHWYFACTDSKLTNNARLVAGADLRANGGFVVAPPSINGKGKAWKWVEGLKPSKIALPYLPESYLLYIMGTHGDPIYSSNSINKHVLKGGINEEKTPVSTNVYKMFKEGTRDEDLFHVANCLFKGRMPEQEVVQVLEKLALSCNPPFDLKEIPAKIESAFKRLLVKERNMAEEVESWVLSTNGNFLSTDVHKCLHLSTRQEIKNVSEILKRLKDKGIVEKWGDKNGQFRLIDSEAPLIDWYNVEVNNIDIKYPFGVERLVNTMPKNIIVIAGSPDAGKTAFLLNVVAMNMEKFKINYFSSEMGAMELKARMKKFDFPFSKWRINARERSHNFADVIKPEEINIIDYMELTEDFWRVGGMIKGIYDKLTTGIALIALQKAPGAIMARGGVGSLEKPRLYLTMEAGRIKIEKGKNWAQENVNPNGLVCNYKIVQGCKILPQTEWYKPDELKKG